MEQLAQAQAGDRRSLARLITLVESGGPQAQAALAAAYPHTGKAHIVGVTGAPGTGKSTLVNALAKAIRGTGRTVGIVAVDPTSPFSGGAILGDRVRMRDLTGDPGIYIRSMATRGNLGGLAQATGDVVKVLDAAGFDVVVVETVGAGQAEIDIARTAHTTVVIEAPGLGDDVQAMKAGLLEVADILVVNKADCKGADILAMDLEAVTRKGSGSPAQVSMTVATESKGIVELLQCINKLDNEHRDSGERKIRRRMAHDQEVLDWCLEIMRPRLLADITKRNLPLLGDPRQKAKEILEEQ